MRTDDIPTRCATDPDEAERFGQRPPEGPVASYLASYATEAELGTDARRVSRGLLAPCWVSVFGETTCPPQSYTTTEGMRSSLSPLRM
jgi:hypothetical protein